MELEQFLTQPFLELTATSGSWRRRARTEGRHAKGMDEHCLAAAPTSGGLAELGLHWHQHGAGSFKHGSQSFVEPGETNDLACWDELRVKRVQFDRDRKSTRLNSSH